MENSRADADAKQPPSYLGPGASVRGGGGYPGFLVGGLTDFAGQQRQGGSLLLLHVVGDGVQDLGQAALDKVLTTITATAAATGDRKSNRKQQHQQATPKQACTSLFPSSDQPPSFADNHQP